MTTRSWLVTAALVALVLAGCSKVSSKFCEQHPDDTRCGSTDAAVTACTIDPDCTSPDPVCDLDTRTCVECIAPDRADACSAGMPICGDDHRCRACTDHHECTSAACLPDGRCAAEADVAYVVGGAAGASPCTKSAPCGTLEEGVDALLPIIKMSGDVRDDGLSVIDGRALSIIAEPGTTLDRTNDGTILEVRSANADVAIFDLDVINGTGLSDPAILVTANGGSPKLSLTRVRVDNSQGEGIVCMAGTLTVTRSTISNNRRGGIAVRMDATFDITNSYIFRNGDPDASAYGGLDLGITGPGASRLAFNTIVDNRALANTGGVDCNVALFAAPNNIIARNSLAGNPNAPTAQTAGMCTYPTSIIRNTVTGLAFAKPDAPAPYDYRITAGSDAVDAATTPTTVTIDHEGDLRPQGAQPDIGADEL